MKLDGEILTESCSRHVAEVLSKNQRLRELDLKIENSDDKAMELLCDGLKHSQCTIETLRIHGGILTESRSRYFAEVLRKNQRLRELHLSITKFDERTVQLLCCGLKDPECTIKKLKLYGEISNESCSRHLAELFRGLRQLEQNYSAEKTVGPLNEGLKHPECKIETAELNGKYIIQDGKWNETFMLESPARTQVRVEESGKLRVLAEHEEAQNGLLSESLKP
ncbi:PREDICTED: NACHT, LRR and PYD domains-containing protein 12-like [Thamnophis sirtalis]|uniref:NACHT, LRR and PYD domains-containing protein 12-like n=1 Tax=Thamnophis sirtalis TaxID=35019 RepID=A0A6I9XB12_9SAUR|nr:PREDICTED: NACHT, LRR and PYD domains-containing protein 12-like [Thamnophis sirtalis]